MMMIPIKGFCYAAHSERFDDPYIKQQVVLARLGHLQRLLNIVIDPLPGSQADKALVRKMLDTPVEERLAAAEELLDSIDGYRAML
jgi:hypothetical protein